ncbi:nuclear transport factor 2 family protein [Shewanella litorisediminis]|uniref:Nuclear transport factor 2 family protein n=1 Tax=Shewanella litorisediminis TaxID=1173586 RepID=A0ABX7G050_9GAMM|nr:nuclear transport factor 2 family protein [Shewanella litorisediminis]MCL2918301.1 nuclear transport factor 2 family protein [Shewanella litorisediminis]QRH00650.1 nuclear transport factor 2 family protein [Shewanella litorisediminis]
MIKKALFLAALLVGSQSTAGELEQQQATNVLDALHQHAASANWDAYFALYTQDAVFLGTDAGERWGMDEFRRYASPTKGWTYEPRRRALIEHGDTIMFDELLFNEKYGLTRGSGALVKTAEGWRVLQYHLSFAVPNEVSKDIARQIMAFEAKSKTH